MIEVPYCEKNEISSKRFHEKFRELTNDLYEIKIKLIAKKMRNMFRLKSKNPHTVCAMHEGVCTYKENYIGETKVTWRVLMTAPVNDRVRKNLEVSFIALSRPSLNVQIDAK